MNSGSVPQSAPRAEPELAGDAERLSAWLDGELDESAGAPVVAGLLQRRHLRAHYESWCLVGDALRSGEVLAGHSPRLCARISQALEQEPVLLSPGALRPGLRRHLASGAAVAAAVAVLVLVAVPQLRGSSGGTDAPAVISAAPGGAAELAAATPANVRAARDPRLDPYLQAHRDFVGSGVMPAAAVYLRSGSEGER